MPWLVTLPTTLQQKMQTLFFSSTMATGWTTTMMSSNTYKASSLSSPTYLLDWERSLVTGEFIQILGLYDRDLITSSVLTTFVSRILMELGALFKTDEWSEDRVSADQLASIIAHLLRKQITGATAKRLLLVKFEGDSRSVEKIVEEEDLYLRPLTRDEYVSVAQQLLEEKATMAKDIVEKQQYQKLKWFVGQMMARSAEGTVEPATAEAVLRELLRLPPAEQT